jgi:hypothetical protein
VKLGLSYGRKIPDARMFENRVLRRIFGFEREEVRGGWRKLHNEELHNLYSSTNIITLIKYGRMG